MRQVDDGSGRDRLPLARKPDPLRGVEAGRRRHARDLDHEAAQDLGQQGRVRRPERGACAEPGNDRRTAARATACGSPRPPRGNGACPPDRAARLDGSTGPRGRAPSLSLRVQRRTAAANRACGRALVQPGRVDPRRADDRPRRDDPGQDHQAPSQPRHRHRSRLPLRQPRPRAARNAGRSARRHVRGRADRGRAGRGGRLEAAPPVHAGVVRGGAERPASALRDRHPG